MFVLQVLPTDSGLQMAKRSRLSDYKLKCIPLAKARLLFYFISYERGKEGVNVPLHLFQGNMHLEHSHSS